MSQRSVLVVGNFDGVHLGHQAIVAHARSLAEKADAQVLAITFDPHPTAVLRPGMQPAKLTTGEDKARYLRDAGAWRMRVLRTTRQMLALSPREFVEQLVQTHQPLAIVEGPDFRFGSQRAGDIQTLRELGREFGFDVAVVEPVVVDLSDQLLAPVSSTLVRWLLEQGRVADAARCLGRFHSVRGRVVRGEQRGRTLGIPTANLDPTLLDDVLIPADGVYAGTVEMPDGQRLAAAISVGSKPTFSQRSRLIEAHILDYSGDLYHQSLSVRFARWLRDQQSFPSLGALKEQLARDVAATRELGNLGLLHQPMKPVMAKSA